MSRWLPDRPLRRWLLWIEPDRVRVLHGESWGAQSAFIEAGPHPTQARNSDEIVRACSEACRVIARQLPIGVTILLPQWLTPALAVQFAEKPMPPPVRDAYLRARFHQVYGSAADRWRFRCDARATTGSAVAFAMDDALANRLAALRAGAAQPRVTPSPVWGAGRALKAMERDARWSALPGSTSAFTGWYLQRDIDREVAFWFDKGRAIHVALLPGDERDSENLRKRLQSWASRLALQPRHATLVSGAADSHALQSSTDDHGEVWSVGLFGSMRAGTKRGDASPSQVTERALA